MKKEELFKEMVDLLREKKVSNWYEKNMEKTPQGETINKLEHAVKNNELTVREALFIALVVGVQWEVKFPGVP